MRAFFSFSSASVRANVDLGHAAGQLGQPLLQLFAVIIAGGDVDLAANLAMRPEWLRFRTTFDDRRIVAVDANQLGRAQVGKLDLVQLDPQVFMIAARR